MVLSAANAQGQSSHQGVVIPCASDSDAIAGLATMAGQWAQQASAQLASGGFNSPAKISFAIGGDCSDLWNHPIFQQAFPTLASFTLDANYPAVGAFYLEPNDAYDGGQGLGGSGDAINCLISDSFTF